MLIVGSIGFLLFLHKWRIFSKTETALLKVEYDLRILTDWNIVAVLFLLDLSAAFDTIDHGILINQLEKWEGLSGAVLDWFHSYLSERKSFLSLGDFVSQTFDVESGVPQGSILGPILFFFIHTSSGQHN